MCRRRQHAGLVLLTALPSSAHPVKSSLWLIKASWSPVAFLVPHTIWEGQQLLRRTASQGGISFAADRHELRYFSCSGCCCLRDQNKPNKNLHFQASVSYRTDVYLSPLRSPSRCSHWRLLQGKTASIREPPLASAEARGVGTAGVMLEWCLCAVGSETDAQGAGHQCPVAPWAWLSSQVTCGTPALPALLIWGPSQKPEFQLLVIHWAKSCQNLVCNV